MIAATFSGSGFRQLSSIKYPKKWIWVSPKKILSAPAFKPLFASIFNMSPARFAHYSWLSPPVAKSSINAPTNSYSSSSAIAWFTMLWKWGGPFLGPKGMTSQQNSSSGVTHPSFWMLSNSTGTCQKPDFRSYLHHTLWLPINNTTARM